MESTTRCPLSHRELEIRNTLGTLCGSNHRAAGAIHASPMVGESGLKRARGLKLAPHSRPRDNKKNTYDTSLFICICMSFSRPEVGVVFNRKSKSFKWSIASFLDWIIISFSFFKASDIGKGKLLIVHHFIPVPSKCVKITPGPFPTHKYGGLHMNQNNGTYVVWVYSKAVQTACLSVSWGEQCSKQI